MDKQRLTWLLLLAALLALLATMTACKQAPQKEEEASTYSSPLNEEIPPAELEQAKQARGKADTTPLEKFTYSWTDSKDIPDIVVIVDDFGSSGALLDDYANLPSEVVFAVLPDLGFTKKAGEIAAQHGHEVLIHVPMQPLSTSEKPGKNYIKADSTPQEISSLLTDFHAQLPMAMGANNHMGSAVTASRDAMTAVLNQLHAAGLVFVDSATTAESVGPSLARTLGYPALKRDIFLDVPDNTDATLASKISSLGKYKGRSQPVVIITHCHNRTKLEALQKFLTQIQGMGLHLTTLSRASGYAA